MISVKDITWLAGLLEGEGSFKKWGAKKSLTISLQMADKDIVHRAGKLMNVKVGYSDHTTRRNPKWKPIWYVNVCGRRAAEWMMTLYCLMGERRKQQIREALQEWKLAARGSRKFRVGSTYIEEGVCDG